MKPLLYTVSAAELHAHLFTVTLRIPEPAAQQVVSLPVWIPGSYLVREFAKHLQNLSVRQGWRTLDISYFGKGPNFTTCHRVPGTLA